MILAVLTSVAATAAAMVTEDPEKVIDVTEVGVSNAWLIFGFAAQATFMARFIVQWLASERAGRSVIPRAFWWLSLAGGVSLFIYFTRRGDPVGMLGQSTGILIYARNIIFIRRERQETKRLQKEQAADTAGNASCSEGEPKEQSPSP